MVRITSNTLHFGHCVCVLAYATVHIMRALSLHGCFAWAVIHAGKDIENRVWGPADKHFGTRIAIHASGNPGNARAQAYVRRLASCAAPATFPTSAIVGTVQLLGVVTDLHEYDGMLTDAQADAAAASAWYIGPVGWVLSDPVPLAKPIPCPGKLSLWDASHLLGT